MAFIIKILGGSNQGAEALLGNEMLVGRAEDCDIILNDDGVADHHLKIQFDGTKGFLTVLESPVYLDGEPIAGDGAPVLPLQIISFGFVHMAFGEETSNWQALKLPLIKPPDNAPEGIPENADSPENTADNALENADAPANDALPDNAPQTPPSPANTLPPSSHSSSHKSSHASSHRVAVWLPMEEERKKPVVSIHPIDAVEKMLASYDDTTLKATKTGSFVQINGFLVHSSQLDALKQALQKQQLLKDVRFNVQVGDKVARTLQNSLRAENLKVEVKLSGNELRLFGVLGNKQALNKVIADDRLGNFVLKDETITNGELRNYILKSLEQKKFKGHIELMANNDSSLSVAGLVGKNDYAIWQERMRALTKAYPLLVINDEVRRMPLGDFNLKSVVIGPKSFVTLANGQIITEGEPFKGGFTLAKITDSHLLLKMDSRQYKYIYH